MANDNIIQFDRKPAALPQTAEWDREAYREAFRRDLQAVIAKHCPEYFTAEGQEMLQEIYAEREAGLLTW